MATIRSSLTLVALAALAGCATIADVDKAKASWQGATYDEVVARWGQPLTGDKAPSGLERRVWVSESTPYASGPSVGMGVFGGSGGGGGVGVGINLPIGSPSVVRCERILYFRDAIVVDQEWSGSASYCSGFRRAR